MMNNVNALRLGYLTCHDWDSRKGEPIGEGKYYIQKGERRLREFDTRDEMLAWFEGYMRKNYDPDYSCDYMRRAK